MLQLVPLFPELRIQQTLCNFMHEELLGVGDLGTNGQRVFVILGPELFVCIFTNGLPFLPRNAIVRFRVLLL